MPVSFDFDTITTKKHNITNQTSNNGYKSNSSTFRATMTNLSSWLLPLEGLDYLPGEVWVVPAKMSISCCLEIPVPTPL